MAMDAAKAVKWLTQNISRYGGDSTKIYVSGHSAGGQIAAIIATDNSYFEKLGINNPVKGAIMIDAFGLDMYDYLQKNSKFNRDLYLSVFTKDPENWKKLSPILQLHEGMPPFLLYIGDKTVPNISRSNKLFFTELIKYQPSAQLITVKNSRHVDMIFSFLNQNKKAYGEIIGFMKESSIATK